MLRQALLAIGILGSLAVAVGAREGFAPFSFTTPVPKGRMGTESPLETLQRRYARGEIDTAEYEERKARLMADRSAGAASSSPRHRQH